jgi:hypothetical protein
MEKLHNEGTQFIFTFKEYYDDQINVDEMREACTEHAVDKNAYKMFVRKLEGKITIGRLRSRWDDNIKVDFRDSRFEGVG